MYLPKGVIKSILNHLFKNVADVHADAVSTDALFHVLNIPIKFSAPK